MVSMVLMSSAGADSIRCGRKIVKVGETSSALIRKCGDPERKYSSKQMLNEHGRTQRISVSNWVYQRRGKKDMIVSVRDGVVVKIEVD